MKRNYKLGLLKTMSLFFMASLLSLGASAQYQYNQTTGTPNGTSGNAILYSTTGSIDQQLSAWQTLPFPFSYYGKTVTGYYLSDNGYITFDNTATKSIATNDSLNKAGVPKNAIFAFWDDLYFPQSNQSTGVYYYANAYTIGIAPQRIHVIQWYAAMPAGQTPNTSNFVGTVMVLSIRLYECGDFDISIDHHGASLPTMSGTMGCTNSDGTMYTMIGGPNMDLPATTLNGSGQTTKSVLYQMVNKSNKYDVNLTSIANLKSLYNSGSAVAISGTVVNSGSDTLNSFTMHYQIDGNSAQNLSVTSANIAPGASYTYSFANSYTAASGSHMLKVWTEANTVNGSNTDVHLCNDTISFNFAVPAGTKKTPYLPLVEEFTGAWCGWCPNGALTMDSLMKVVPDAPLVAIHGPIAYGLSNDQMMLQKAAPIVSAYASGFPSAAMGRQVFNNNGALAVSAGVSTDGYEWVGLYKTIANQTYAPVQISMNKSYDATAQTMDVTVKANFVDYAIPGDIRVNLYVTEDGVTGSGAGWDQHIYSGIYNDANNPLYHRKNSVADPNYAPGTAWFMHGWTHNHVLRDIISATWGDSGIIPMMPIINQTYQQSYTGIDVSSYNVNNVKIIAFLSYYDPSIYKMQVLNASKASYFTGVEEMSKASNVHMAVYPNPAQGVMYSEFNFEKPTKISFDLYNMMGQKVLSKASETYPSGNNAVGFDISGLAKGVYNLTMTTSEGSTVQRVVIQ